MSDQKRILIAPLNWGLGHATRCIPLIEQYLYEGWDVTLASDGDARRLLQAEFPSLECHELPGYGISYPKNGKAMVSSMLSQLPRLTARISQEKKWLSVFLKNHPQDLILSDSRYGLYHANVESIIVCHQTSIRSPRLKGMIDTLHARLLQRFDALWIPDDEVRSLSGELSSLPLSIPVKCIGPLSRLRPQERSSKSVPLVALLSGPEPQRSMLEKLLTPILSQVPGAVLVRGLMDDNTETEIGGLKVKGHLLSEELQCLLSSADQIICRSGYSSLMDLEKMGLKAILIPTPGQTEQEYLAERLALSGGYRAISQDDIPEKLEAMILSNKPA